MASDGKLPHSHSTPAGVDGGVGCVRTPPPTPKKGGKMLAVRVQMLDDSVTMFQVQAKALGRVLFEQVCRQLNLLEADYFGLEYQDPSGTKYWLDLEKALNRQVGLSMVDTLLRFSVKFYTPDPSQLEEEFTRYLFCLQIKRDLAQGNLQCNDNTSALMASYIVQAECGDFVAEDYPDHTYLSSYKFVPHQDAELERRIMENHKKHVSQPPAEADLNLLETARRCELYGMKMHPAKDHEGVPLNLATAHMGLVVFQNYTKINTFSWAKIRKISFKRKRFLIKLHPEGYGQGYYKDTVDFFFDGRNECKNFWKKCVEHHGFFRCCAVKNTPRQKTRVISRGSSFRYSGKTQKQIVEFVRENYVKRQTFHRSQSFRHTSSLHSSVGNVGTSISAQPLLPLGDNMVSTPASLSCGSMTVASEPHSPGSPGHTETADIHDFDTRDLDTPSIATSHQDTLSPGTSVMSSPQRQEQRVTDDEYSASPLRAQQQQPQPMHHHHYHQAEVDQMNEPSPLVSPKLPPPPPLSPRINHVTHKKAENGFAGNNMDHHSDRSSATSQPSSPTKSIPEESSLSLSKINSPNLSAEVDMRRKPHKYPGDKAYFIAKEILMTERTYKKDLEVINLWFREQVNKEDLVLEDVLNLLFTIIDPIYGLHCVFLKEIEQRVLTWEGKTTNGNKIDYQRVGDILVKTSSMLQQHYPAYIDKNLVILERLEQSIRRNKTFEQLYQDFEAQKVCYLPFSFFLLKPLERLVHYKRLFDKLIYHYGKDHPDFEDCILARDRLTDCIIRLPEALRLSENYVKLVELQHEVVGVDNLVVHGREFIREGCLQKLSRKGYQQRMFFLLSDVLLYTSRSIHPNLQFKVHGQLPLKGITVEETDSNLGVNHCFVIYGGNRALTVAASSQEEKDKWMEDLSLAIHIARDRQDNLYALTLKSCSSSDEVLDHTESAADMQLNSRPDKHTQQRSNTTVHVCWHRNTSVSMRDILRTTENQLSGYLLRKFKNSNGWQKLWVVFTNFCLFFYKTSQDDFPLASLPLLGYSVSTPNEKDGIVKDMVFKLQFKNHVYFFRADCEYSFTRWMEVINSGTQHSSRIRLFSRKDSQNVIQD